MMCLSKTQFKCLRGITGFRRKTWPLYFGLKHQLRKWSLSDIPLLSNPKKLRLPAPLLGLLLLSLLAQAVTATGATDSDWAPPPRQPSYHCPAPDEAGSVGPGQTRPEGELPQPSAPTLAELRRPTEQPTATALERLASHEVNEGKDGMLNTQETRWKDYELITTVKNMLLCMERQYNDFHGELAKCRNALTDRSKERKDKAYEKIQNMEYESKKMEHLLKRFHVEIKTPDERYEHETNKAKWWKRVKRGVKISVALVHFVGGNFAMISNQANWEFCTNFKEMGIIANHIKDLDFTISAVQTLAGEATSNLNLFEEWDQALYPLQYTRKMLDQVRSIQDSVHAEGMKAEERVDWNGVKMQLFRIFQQEQFILRVVEDEAAEQGAVDIGTSSRLSAVMTDFGDETKDETPLKRFLFTLDYHVTKEMCADNVIDKAHSLMYIKTDDKVQGFIHLKEYTSLLDVAELLHINGCFASGEYVYSPHFKVCEVRGKTEDILKGTALVRTGVDDKGQVTWAPCAAWSKAFAHVENDVHRIFGESYTKTTHDLSPCGWMYVEQSLTSAANERLAKAEEDFKKLSEAEKNKSKNKLIDLDIYDKDWWNKDDMAHWEEITKVLQGEPWIRLNGNIESRKKLIECLEVQLGNPDVTHEDRKKLAMMLQTNGRTTQFYQPRFYTYDDKPSFNLVSGIMQAKEDVWQKNSIIELLDDVKELKQTLQSRALRSPVNSASGESLGTLRRLAANSAPLTPSERARRVARRPLEALRKEINELRASI